MDDSCSPRCLDADRALAGLLPGTKFRTVPERNRFDASSESPRRTDASAIPFAREGQRIDLLEGQVDIEVSSAHLDWPDVVAERGAVRGWDVSEPATVTGDYVAVNLSDETLVFEGGTRGAFERLSIPPQGVWVQPAEMPFRMVHGQQMTYGSLTLGDGLVHRHAGLDRGRLHQYYGVDAQASRLVQIVLEEARRGLLADPLLVETCCEALSIHLARTYREHPLREEREERRLSRAEIKRVADYVDSRRGARLLVADLATLLNMSSAHFSRLFRATVGVPPHRYIIRHRLLRVREALASTDDTILAIAFENGFADQSHLTRVFRKAFGLTPGEYRNAARHTPDPTGQGGR